MVTSQRGERSRDPTRTIKEDLRRRCLVRAAAQRQALLAQHRQASEAISMATIVAEELRRTPVGGDAARPSAWSEADEATLQALGLPTPKEGKKRRRARL